MKQTCCLAAKKKKFSAFLSPKFMKFAGVLRTLVFRVGCHPLPIRDVSRLIYRSGNKEAGNRRFRAVFPLFSRFGETIRRDNTMCKELFTATSFICGCTERDFEGTLALPKDCLACGTIRKKECVGHQWYPFPCTRCVSRYEWTVDEYGVWSRKEKAPAPAQQG